MRKNKQKNIEKDLDVNKIINDIKKEEKDNVKTPKEVNEKEYIEYEDLSKMATKEYMTKPMLFNVFKVKRKGIKVKLDNKIIEVTIGKYICLFTNNIIKIMSEKELQEIGIEI